MSAEPTGTAGRELRKAFLDGVRFRQVYASKNDDQIEAEAWARFPDSKPMLRATIDGLVVATPASAGARGYAVREIVAAALYRFENNGDESWSELLPGGERQYFLDKAARWLATGEAQPLRAAAPPAGGTEQDRKEIHGWVDKALAACVNADSFEEEQAVCWALVDKIIAYAAAMARRAPEETALERFERLADEFYRETGLMAPGKSVPMEMGNVGYDEERHTRWRTWLDLRRAPEGARDGIGDGPGDERWGEPMRWLTDDRDLENRLELVVMPGGNGDWYVSVVPEGQFAAHGVRICTSGGAASYAPELPRAMAMAYWAMLRAAATPGGAA